MDEVFPIICGIALGLATYAIRPNWFKVVLIGVAGFGLGTTASWVSGELAVSRVYILIDAAQVTVAAIMSELLVRRWLRRREIRLRARDSIS